MVSVGTCRPILHIHDEVDTNIVTETEMTHTECHIDTNTVAVLHEYGKFRALTENGRTDRWTDRRTIRGRTTREWTNVWMCLCLYFILTRQCSTA